MTPNDLAEYLKVLRNNKVAAAVVKINRIATIQVTFQPEMPEPPTTADPVPGGWKAPTHLDQPQEYRVEELP